MSKGSMLVLALFFGMALATKANTPSLSGKDVTASPVDCREGKGTTVAPSGGGDGAAFAVHRGGPAVQDGSLDTDGERNVALGARRGASAYIPAMTEGHVAGRRATADRAAEPSCEGRRSYQYTSYHADRHATGGRLPFTGPPADLMGRIAMAGGLVLTGGLFWWYGAVWPRRTPIGPIVTRRSPYGPRRHPGPGPRRPATRSHGHASVMPVRARPPADSRTAAATAPDTSG
ncbi:hypothetical protein [Streptosporangium lutulentum]|uniref:Uncharacterized protein n=1 Tax=Streptosporangium lutulentum TaxID=1461250 RepID=A0ABT9QHB8_9ACTN|nr:hypothetical protein [Streptosporangium lutulentum]MDP9846143.1 hypothetical protein [Streptosporangium lutulentum]